ncbi:hypothetical protein J4N45_11155 [Vibrio sp. SCSIO 43140]|uniref:endonuclease/exonuclease/phosphatase family protein n=1 Tax=Vibrio sp. SCSIO 43140 TaxID=2819100 RepID=UPI002075EA00|nr:endonuclease/exonuclease/phosphatase family protein [Vibrio sp. SCSIO 43140]USD59089.1 hypothetical protein J4N45_11155 [Vibrio sp. SCSIO 43140]
MKKYLLFAALVLFYVHGAKLFESNPPSLVDSAHAGSSNSVTFIGYNIEAGYKPDAELDTVLSLLDQLPATHVYALTELTASWSTAIAAHLGDNYHYVINQNVSDNADAMAIFYDAKRLKVEEAYERPFGVHKHERKMVYARFTDAVTNKSFAVVNNHFMRGRGPTNGDRQEQAKQLQKWVKGQTVPVIALGDYNFDLDVKTGQANPSYYLFTADNDWRWVKPSTLIKTGCHKGYNSILDFAFLSGEVRSATSEIMFPEASYCNDNKRKPDHRPIYAVVDF